MSKLFAGSICLTALNEAAKKGHSAFMKSATNNKIYVNLNIWENDTPDKYENTHSIQLNPKKDSTDEKIYVGNAHPIKTKDPEPVKQADFEQIPDDDDLPF